MQRIVVIGGTGLIGSKVVNKLLIRGHDVLAAAPSTGVDTITGDGLADALIGAEIVVDVSNAPSLDERVATAFFETAGGNLAAAEADAGVRHHVALSIVGTDRMQCSGYFRAKLAQERLLAGWPISTTLVRATQFFEFLHAVADISTVAGEVRLSPVGFQPIAADDVAEALAEVSLGNPVNGSIEIAGPDRLTLDEAVRRVLARDGDPRPVVADRSAPYFGVTVEDTTLVPGRDARLGPTRYDWWLSHVAMPGDRPAPCAPVAAGAS